MSTITRRSVERWQLANGKLSLKEYQARRGPSAIRHLNKRKRKQQKSLLYRAMRGAMSRTAAGIMSLMRRRVRGSAA